MDPDGNDLPQGRLQEIEVHKIAALTRAQQIKEAEEPRVTESCEMQASDTTTPPAMDTPQATNSNTAEGLAMTAEQSQTAQQSEAFTWEPEIGAETQPDLKTLC